MQILISPVSVEEALCVARGGADIVDVKNTDEGSLGANFPWVIRDVVGALAEFPVTFSATLGDLPHKPGTAALAALGATYAGARYVKAGLYDIADEQQAIEVMNAVGRACRDEAEDTIVVAAGYADWRCFGGLDPLTIIAAARAAGADAVMIDTALKDGKTLFDNMNIAEIAEFVKRGHECGLKVALAGGIGRSHLPQLVEIGPDIIGVRGAVCADADRTTVIREELVRSFITEVRCQVDAKSTVQA